MKALSQHRCTVLSHTFHFTFPLCDSVVPSCLHFYWDLYTQHRDLLQYGIQLMQNKL